MTAQAPSGWFKLVTPRGRKVVCFACNTCGIFTRFISGPARPVKHCGRVDKAPLLTMFIPERTLSGSDSNFVQVGTWNPVSSPFEFEEV